MQFKIKDIKVRISFTFFALVLLLVIFRKNDFLYLTCFFAVFHEMGHLFALRNFGVIITDFEISFLGANIKTENFKKIKPAEEIKILFAGPFVNLLILNVFILLNCFYEKELFTKICLINLCLFIFNMLPFYNFDGGKIIEILLKCKFREKTSDVLITCISFIILIPFIWFSINVFLKNNSNF